MKNKYYLLIISVFLSCSKQKTEYSFPLSEKVTLEISKERENNLITLQLNVDGKISSIHGEANTDFCCINDRVNIIYPAMFSPYDTAYYIPTCIINSPYGACKYYIVYKISDFLWDIYIIPFDDVSIEDIDNNGIMEILEYKNNGDTLMYSFYDGTLVPYQCAKKIYFNDTTSIYTINNNLKTNNFPIRVTEVKSETERTINLIFESDTNKIEIENIYDNLESVIEFTANNNIYYLCLFYAYAGFDYFYLFDTQKGKVNISGHFNFGQDSSYDFIYHSLDMKGYISVAIHSTKRIDIIKLYEYE